MVSNSHPTRTEPHRILSTRMSSSLFNFRDADLILRSNSQDLTSNGLDSLDFHVHRCVLSAASSFFETMLSLPQPREDKTHIPIIPFIESTVVLETILRYTYPMAEPMVATLDELVLALEAARKYDVTAATEGLRRRLVSPEFLKASPLRVYAIASRYDFDDEAKVAAAATLPVGLHGQPLHEDLKSMDGYAYHRLVLLHEHRAREAIALLMLPDDIRCMFCNSRRQTMNDPPRWWTEYRERAKEELRLRPTSGVIFSLPFLQLSAKAAGCERCAGSILASCWWFEHLREKIDALPATI